MFRGSCGTIACTFLPAFTAGSDDYAAECHSWQAPLHGCAHTCRHRPINRQQATSRCGTIQVRHRSDRLNNNKYHPRCACGPASEIGSSPSKSFSGLPSASYRKAPDLPIFSPCRFRSRAEMSPQFENFCACAECMTIERRCHGRQLCGNMLAAQATANASHIMNSAHPDQLFFFLTSTIP